MAFLGLCALPGSPGARADVFVWAGGAGPDGASWCNQDNWIVGEGYPGRHDRADVVLIWGVDTQDPVVDCAPPFAIADLLVFAGGGLDVVDALSVTGEVSVTDGARLDVSGTLDSSDVSAGKDVTMTVSGQWTGCKLVIPSGSHFVLTGLLVLSCQLTIAPGAVFEIKGGGTFKQTGNVTNEIGGLLVLSSESATYWAGADIVLGPYAKTSNEPKYGRVVGLYPTARILIQQNHVLTNRITVEGTMTIRAWP